MGSIRPLERGRKTFWIRYTGTEGRRHEENTHTDKFKLAEKILKLREGAITKGENVTPQLLRTRFSEGATDLLNDYKVNAKRSTDDTERRLRLHLQPYFGGRLLASITTADVRAYVAKRQADVITVRKARTRVLPNGTIEEVPAVTKHPSNAQINRELMGLKRLFNLALQAGKVMNKPHISLLREANIRVGFFESGQVLAVKAHLPAYLQPVISFAMVTGWRVKSEVLPLTWAQVDFKAGTIRLEPGSTKNFEGRVFPMTDELRRVLEGQKALADAQKKAGHIVPWVFFKVVGKGRGGPKTPRQITSFRETWKKATIKAGCPGRILHDFRRTAVRNLVRAGIPERVAMQMTGHKTRSVFERYNIVSEGDLFDAARRLNAVNAPPEGGNQAVG